MNDRAQVGRPSTPDSEARISGAGQEVFYREPGRLFTALAGGTMILSGIARRSAFGLGLAVAGVSLTYRAITGRTLESVIAELVSRRRGTTTNAANAAGP